MPFIAGLLCLSVYNRLFKQTKGLNLFFSFSLAIFAEGVLFGLSFFFTEGEGSLFIP